MQECIRNWRSSSNSELHEDPYSLTDTAALSKTTKTCPLCRKKSDFIIPSSIFPTPPTSNDLETAKDTDKATRGPGAGKIKEIKNPVKEEIIQGYLSKLKKIPCRYFEEEVKRWREAVAAFDAGEVESCLVSPLRFRPRCFFANQCHYAHIDPATNKPYTFSPQEIRWMKRKRIEERSQQLRARFHITPSEHFDILTRSLEAFSFGEDVLRDSPMRNTSERPAPARPALARPALDVQSLHVALTLAAAFDDMELSDSVDYDFDLEAPHGELLGDYEDDYY
ncbi:zinc finger, C3HC4 type (RING finger) domain containing protein [Emydomyces testavorans]|uniref:Zinc finger, C3HC4 type (RING finger) domain containing protein n=1 Tax=Emydomyces testavorans TaxID=2070801 RepID=A0AAF0DCA6_9EURO|nr:zinc finger, C3HC4 type (RING finger) domain containing protein [Emydomyces testavorans]